MSADTETPFLKAQPFLNLIEVSKGLTLLAIVLISAPLVGGQSPLAIFLFRILTSAALALFLLSKMFRSEPLLDAPQKAILKIPVLFGLSLTLYAFIQSLLGYSGLEKTGLGSTYPYATGQFATQWTYYLVFLVLCVIYFHTRKRVKLLIFLIAVELFILMAGAYYLKLNHLVVSTHITRNPLLFFAGNANVFGGILLAATPFFLASFAYNLRKSHDDAKLQFSQIEALFYALMVVFVTAAIFHAEARAVFIVQLAMLAFFWLFIVKIRFDVKGITFFFAVSLLYLILCQVEITAVVGRSYEGLWQDFQRRLGITMEMTQMALDHLFFGTGFGTFGWVARLYQRTDPEFSIFLSSYNTYLDFLAEMGLVGCGLLFLAFAKWLKGAWTGISAMDSRWIRIHSRSSLLAILTIAALSMVDAYPRSPAIALLLILHMALVTNCAAGKFHSRSTEDQKKVSRPVPLSFRHYFAGYAVIGIILSFGLMQYKTYQAQAIIAKERGFFSRMYSLDTLGIDITAAKKAVVLAPDNAESWGLLGRAYFSRAMKAKGREKKRLLRQAVEAFERSIEAAPTWPDTWYQLGRTKVSLNLRKEGLADMARGVQLAPYNRDTYLLLIVGYLRAADQTPWSEEVLAFKKEALYWLKKSRSLKRPFTIADHGYIADYDHTNSRPQKLHAADEKRWLAFLTRRSSSPSQVLP